MLDNFNTPNTSPRTDHVTISHIRMFLWEHGGGLEEAARLLGGLQWARRVRRLCADARHGSLPRRMCLREMHALLGLLRLECADDLASVEARCFSDIHPADPRVFEICLLTDYLDRFIETDAQKLSCPDKIK